MGGGCVVEGLESLEELVAYLRNPNPEVRAMGTQVALHVTATEEGRRALVETQAMLATLCRLTADTPKVAAAAVSALINLCADELPSVVEELLRRGIVERLMETLTTEDCGFRNTALMLLANVSATKTGARRMMQVEDDDNEEDKQPEQEQAQPTPEQQQQKPQDETQTAQVKEKDEEEQEQEQSRRRNALMGLHVRRLLRWFLASYDPAAEEDEWQHAASVIHNVSQLQEGRDLLRRRQTDLLRLLLPQLESANQVRRRGIASTIRNCCFEEGDHFYLIHEMDVVTHLLYPIMGPSHALAPEEQAAVDALVLRGGDAKRMDADADVRAAIYETLLLFCATRQSREALRQRGVYPVLREADRAETSEENSEIVYKIVNFLQRDEEGSKGAAATAAALLSAGAIGGGGGGDAGLNEQEDRPLDDEGAALPTPLSDLSEREEVNMAALRRTLDDLD